MKPQKNIYKNWEGVLNTIQCLACNTLFANAILLLVGLLSGTFRNSDIIWWHKTSRKGNEANIGQGDQKKQTAFQTCSDNSLNTVVYTIENHCQITGYS